MNRNLAYMLCNAIEKQDHIVLSRNQLDLNVYKLIYYATASIGIYFTLFNNNQMTSIVRFSGHGESIEMSDRLFNLTPVVDLFDKD